MDLVLEPDQQPKPPGYLMNYDRGSRALDRRCDVCQHARGGTYGVCSGTKACFAEYQRRRYVTARLRELRKRWLRQAKSADDLPQPVRCGICTEPTASAWRVCGRYLDCQIERAIREAELAAKLSAEERSRERLAAGRVVLIARLTARQCGECSWCGERLFPPGAGPGPLQVDHIIPVSAGGPSADWNYQALHARCNREKGSRLTARAFALAEEHGIELTGVPAARLAVRLSA